MVRAVKATVKINAQSFGRNVRRRLVDESVASDTRFSLKSHDAMAGHSLFARDCGVDGLGAPIFIARRRRRLITHVARVDDTRRNFCGVVRVSHGQLQIRPDWTARRRPVSNLLQITKAALKPPFRPADCYAVYNM